MSHMSDATRGVCAALDRSFAGYGERRTVSGRWTAPLSISRSWPRFEAGRGSLSAMVDVVGGQDLLSNTHFVGVVG